MSGERSRPGTPAGRPPGARVPDLRAGRIAMETRKVRRAGAIPWVIGAATALDLVLALAGSPSRFVFGLLGPSLLLGLGRYAGGPVLATAAFVDVLVVLLLLFLGLRARGGKGWALPGVFLLTLADAGLMAVEVLQFDNMPMEAFYTHAAALIYLAFGLLAQRRLRLLGASAPDASAAGRPPRRAG